MCSRWLEPCCCTHPFRSTQLSLQDHRRLNVILLQKVDDANNGSASNDDAAASNDGDQHGEATAGCAAAYDDSAASNHDATGRSSDASGASTEGPEYCPGSREACKCPTDADSGENC